MPRILTDRPARTVYEESSNLNDEKRSSLYYISGYVTFKENLGIQVEESETLPRNSEFLQLVSRGKLAHPPPELYDLSLYYYSFFKARTPKCCNKIFLQAYQLIYEASSCDYDNIKIINKETIFKLFL